MTGPTGVSCHRGSSTIGPPPTSRSGSRYVSPRFHPQCRHAPRDAVGSRELEAADRLPAGEDVTDPHRRDDRLVRRARRSVVDHDDAATGQPSREGDPARQGRRDDLADRAGQVDPAMPGPPRRVGWVERSHHRRRRLQRPHPDRGRVHGRADRADRPRQGEERDQHHGNDDQRRATVGPDPVGE